LLLRMLLFRPDGVLTHAATPAEAGDSAPKKSPAAEAAILASRPLTAAAGVAVVAAAPAVATETPRETPALAASAPLPVAAEEPPVVTVTADTSEDPDATPLDAAWHDLLPRL